MERLGKETSKMLEVQQPERQRRPSLISQIYSEDAFANAPGRDKARLSAISDDGNGKEGWKEERKEDVVALGGS
jgi:hypothetical protein